MDVWWKQAVIYEILVPSFKDSNGDGIGDLPGIIEGLDYLQDLGITAVWLSPIFRTGFFDVGYDVIDYCDVDPRFGRLDDYTRLLDEAHRRELRVIIDFVPNHTSHQHPWFQDAISSRASEHRPFYIWEKPGLDGAAPNNWVNRFGDSAWTFDASSGEYYLGSFAPEQPDLNWRCADVRRTLLDSLRFWLRLGTDGVRVDALAHLVKDRYVRRNPINQNYNSEEDPSNRVLPYYSQNQPELQRIIRMLKHVMGEFSERVFVGEVFQTPEQISSYQRAGADLLLSTSLFQGKFDARTVQASMDRMEACTPGSAWPAHASGDHDLPRLASRHGCDQARLMALLQFTVRCTPAMYYGEELCLENVQIPADKMMDPSGKREPRYSRDPYRAPMPWNAGPNGGFTQGQPWLPTDARTVGRNVAAQAGDPTSVLNFYRRLLKLRRTEPLLRTGDYRPLDAPENTVAFERLDLHRPGDPRLVVILNLSQRSVHWPPLAGRWTRLFSTQIDQVTRADELAEVAEITQLTLAPHEGIIVRYWPQVKAGIGDGWS